MPLPIVAKLCRKSSILIDYTKNERYYYLEYTNNVYFLECTSMLFFVVTGHDEI
jgi:hypothetical protein